jgi:hypothetical protein
MNTKRTFFLIPIAAVIFTASLAFAAPRAAPMMTRPMGARPASAMAPRTMPGRTMPGIRRDFDDRFHRFDFDHRFRFRNRTFVFVDAFGFPFFSPFAWGAWGYPYPYPYYPYGGYYGSSYNGGAGDGSAYSDRSQVAALQRQLARAGYYHGAIDGIFGPQTQRAVRAYQRDHNAPA